MKVLLTLLLLIPLTSLASNDSTNGIIGKDYQLKASQRGGISKTDFELAIKEFTTFFDPIVYRDFNRELVIYKNYQSNTVNAYADQSSSRAEITIFGGMAKHQRATKDMVTLILCHELGHHLGGYPKKADNQWSSAEGQADYFATSKCLKRLWENQNNEESIDWSLVDSYLKQTCGDNNFLCLRSNLAAKQLALLFNDLEENSLEPDFSTPDLEVAPRMEYGHPYAQCRLDTYFQGSLCSVSPMLNFDNYSETLGACTSSTHFSVGLRPTCWFKPKVAR